MMQRQRPLWGPARYFARSGMNPSLPGSPCPSRIRALDNRVLYWHAGARTSMPLFEIATAAQLAGSVVLALFFVLLERHDPRPYLADWMAAWLAQAVALAVFLASLRWGWTISVAAYLVLEAGHGLLLCAAARHYHGRSLRRSRYGW